MSNNDFIITIFTPTYNRAYILPKLKESLCRQDRYDFEWLIIDDGSTDNTTTLVNGWLEENLPFSINYHKVANGGKCRAINLACQLAKSEWLFIIDSDDYLIDNSIGFIINGINSIANDPSFIGVGVLRGTKDGKALGQTIYNSDYVDATDLQRSNYGLDFDCNEAYRISHFRQFPFEVWNGEKFTPEAVVLKEIALHGYKLRWYNRVIVITEYLPDGLTLGSWSLIKHNPMGYAMLFNHKLKYEHDTKSRIYNVCQFLAYCMVSGNYSYISKCNDKLLSFLCLPLGGILAIRRWLQFRNMQ